MAFLSLFAGSAIGFLVSQGWYLWFNKTNKPFRITELEPLVEVLVESAGLKKELRNDTHVIEAVSDYVFNIEAKGEFRSYSKRRWDMYLLLSSTRFTILIGALLGLILRFAFQFVLFKGSFSIDTLNLTELLSWIIMSFLVIVLTVVLGKGRHSIMESYRFYYEGFIRYAAKRNRKKLREAFPDYFPWEIEIGETN